MTSSQSYSDFERVRVVTIVFICGRFLFVCLFGPSGGWCWNRMVFCIIFLFSLAYRKRVFEREIREGNIIHIAIAPAWQMQHAVCVYSFPQRERERVEHDEYIYEKI